MIGVQRHGPLAEPGNYLSEEELWAGHIGERQRRRCLCGGYVTAIPRYPQPGVAEHRATDRHRRWASAWLG
jgi:hypothetical protein